MAGYMAAGHVPDQEGRHLRRRQDPDRDDLHGRLRPGRRVLQRAEGRRSRCSAGTRPSRTASSSGDNPFEDTGAVSRSHSLVSQGADILFPVAGPAGEGALQAAKASSGKVNAIWVDTDGCVSAEAYCANIVTSVYKGMDVAVTDASRRPRTAASATSRYVGTLENDGTGLSPFHDFDSKVPAELKTEIDKIKADIIERHDQDRSKSQPQLNRRAEHVPTRHPPRR